MLVRFLLSCITDQLQTIWRAPDPRKLIVSNTVTSRVYPETNTPLPSSRVNVLCWMVTPSAPSTKIAPPRYSPQSPPDAPRVHRNVGSVSEGNALHCNILHRVGFGPVDRNQRFQLNCDKPNVAGWRCVGSIGTRSGRVWDQVELVFSRIKEPIIWKVQGLKAMAMTSLRVSTLISTPAAAARVVLRAREGARTAGLRRRGRRRCGRRRCAFPRVARRPGQGRQQARQRGELQLGAGLARPLAERIAPHCGAVRHRGGDRGRPAALDRRPRSHPRTSPPPWRMRALPRLICS